MKPIILAGALCLSGCFLARSQNGLPTGPSHALEQLSQSVQSLAARVSPCVVQITVTRFAPRDDGETGRTGLVLSRQQVVGSGAIIDPDGYIVTNAHVVENALRIRVNRLVQKAGSDTTSTPGHVISDTLAQALAPEIDATLVGVFKELDVALIKIPAQALPALHFADYQKLRQGEVVFAFGSRRGLGNSMSMGVVSSVARQVDPDSPFVYIQTDAPINPGDSGGPLVNTSGELVGMDTFILTQSGGSEGIGFAIPSSLIQLSCAQLRKYGHMHRQLIGVGVQAITPILAAALHLTSQDGVLISDVTPGGPAETAGVKLNDIVTAIDGERVENVPLFTTILLAHPAGKNVSLEILRGGEKLSIEATPVEESHKSDHLLDLIDPERNRIRPLGIIGLAVDEKTADLFPGLRGPYGVIVVSLSASQNASMTGLQVGDVIHEVNGTAVSNVDGLRAAMEKLKRGDAAALFIERDGKLQYLAFEIE
ncbi:MAG TPA: trypsin-like peptidase domain-containing protein [Verrucomicrobiae bacterium]|nr:trypsin-like peptidase domain-containing protein [Verrucomicrobiae bacterium]